MDWVMTNSPTMLIKVSIFVVSTRIDADALFLVSGLVSFGKGAGDGFAEAASVILGGCDSRFEGTAISVVICGISSAAPEVSESFKACMAMSQLSSTQSKISSIDSRVAPPFSSISQDRWHSSGSSSSSFGKPCRSA